MEANGSFALAAVDEQQDEAVFKAEDALPHDAPSSPNRELSFGNQRPLTILDLIEILRKATLIQSVR